MVCLCRPQARQAIAKDLTYYTFHYYSITMKYHAFKSLYTYSIGSALQVKLSNIVITGILVSSWFGRLLFSEEVHLRS